MSEPIDTASDGDAASPAIAAVQPPAMPHPSMENLLSVMQHVAAIIEQALNTHRHNWNRLVFLGERHAAALACVQMLRCYDAAGGAALHYLNDDLGDLLRVPDLAEKMRSSLQGKAGLMVALHFLRGLEAGLLLD